MPETNGQVVPATIDRTATVADLVAAVAPPERMHARLAQVRQRTLARPVGSLGRLDEISYQIAGIRRAPLTGPLPAVVSVLAADHGVARQGVSRFTHGLTGQVLGLINDGAAPVNLLADRVPARVETADFGLVEPVGDQRYKVAAGTHDICSADAMTEQEAADAVRNGARYAADRLADAEMVGVGEIGVGNTTTTSVLAARLLGTTAAAAVGAGSGVDSATVALKRALVDSALRRTAPVADDPMRLLAAVGGLEIAGNVGVILAAAARHQVVVLDGTITAVAALVAVRLCPSVRGYLIAAHRSAEPVHGLLLDALGTPPVLSLDMRLGMASGAALAMGLINATLVVATSTPNAASVGLTVRS